MKKFLCVLTLLLMAVPAFAAPIIQGSNTFTYSNEIDKIVNPVDDITGWQEYLSLTSPTISFKDLDTVFPDRLSAIAFTASYAQGTKTTIFPGALALNFTKDQILAYLNGNAIMTALQNSSDPAQTLFQYFDPIIVVNGPDGNTVSYNIKSFLSFNFMAENNWNAMTVTANIVLAGGYPKGGFFIEDINGYPFIFDTIVSETSQPKAVDGKIEFAFGLVPNGEVLGTGVVGKYPLMETDSGNGYVIFESPENYLDITEIAAMNGQPARLSSGTISFMVVDDGLSFSIPYSNYPGTGVSLVNTSVYMSASRLEELGVSHEDENSLLKAVSVKIGNYMLSPSSVSMLPDGSAFVSVGFLLVDNDFVSDIFISGDTVIVFDGDNDGELKAVVTVVGKQASEEQPSVFTFGHSSLTVNHSQIGDIDNFSPVFDVDGAFESVYLPVLEGMAPMSSVVFTGTYSYKTGSFMPAVLETVIAKSDLTDEVADSIGKAVSEDGVSFAEAVLTYIRPVMMLGDSPFDVYEYLKTNGREDLLSVSGSIDTGIYMSLPVYVADAVPAKVALGDDYIMLYDGEENGKFVLQFYIGVLDIEQEETVVEKTFDFNNGSITVTPSVEISDSFNAVYDVAGMFAETTMPVLPSFAQNLMSVKFEGTYVSGADNNAMPSVMETVFSRNDLPEEVSSGIESVLENGFSEAVLSYVRPIMSVGNIRFDVYDYLKLNNGLDLMTVSGSLDTGIVISVPVAVIDSDLTKVLIDDGVLLLYDGAEDGKFTVNFCIGVLKHEEEADAVPEAIISAQGISVKTLPSLETDASVTKISRVTNTALLPGGMWPGREGFTDAVSVNGFSLSYDNAGFTKPGALPVTLSVSATANELSALSSENYNKVLAGEPFFDHFHIFKMIGSEVYDLNTIGGESMFTITGDPVQRLLISFNAVLVDAEGQLPVVASGDSFVFYDGQSDGQLTDPLFIAAVKEAEEEHELTSVPYNHGSVTLTFDNELGFNLHPVTDIQGSISETTLPLADKFIQQVAPVAFEGQYQSDTDNNAVSGIWEFIVYGSDLSENIVSAIKGSELSLRETVFEYIRPVILAGNIQFDVYDYLQTNGKTDLIGVAGSVDTGIVITVPFVVVDSPVYKVVIDDKYLVIYDGNADGKFVLKSYIGIMGVEEVEKPTVVLESPSLSLKTKPIDIPEDLDVEAIEDIEFEDAGYAEWPDKEGVLGGVSVGSFVGEYDHNLYSKDGAVSVAVSVSVTPAELKGMFAKGKERYDKMLSEWLAGSKERFLDYYHVYKQVGDGIYDLVLIGGKEVFSLQGDPTTKITISFPAVLIDGEDISPVTFNSDISAFIVYDGKSDGQLTDPLFVGAPETVPTAEGETPEEEETKHILPDNPAGPSTGHDDIGKWFKIFSLF